MILLILKLLLTCIYQVASRVQGLVQIVEQPMIRRNDKYKIILETRGFIEKPKSEHELQCMAQDILYGLCAIHKA